MNRERHPPPAAAPWHVDLRLEDELPDDRIVGTRFLLNVVFTVLAAAPLLYFGWLGTVALSLRHQTRDWEQRIADNRAEMLDIQRMQREFGAEADKIDQAYAMMKSPFVVSELVAELGRTRPEQATIQLIEWNELGIFLRGSLRERSDSASRLLGSYVEELRRNKKIGPLFREIVLTDLDRSTGRDLLRFEIVLRTKEGI